MLRGSRTSASPPAASTLLPRINETGGGAAPVGGTIASHIFTVGLDADEMHVLGTDFFFGIELQENIKFKRMKETKSLFVCLLAGPAITVDEPVSGVQQLASLPNEDACLIDSPCVRDRGTSLPPSSPPQSGLLSLTKH